MTAPVPFPVPHKSNPPEPFDTFATLGTIETGEVPKAEIERLWPAFPDRYEVLEHHASGGMGEVWRVRDCRLDRVLAGKVLPAGATPNARERFNREARTLALLDHPAIVPIIDVGHLGDGRPWFTMPLILGSTLDKQVISWRKGRDERTQRRHLEALRTVAQAIAHAHERRVVHRDIKPANIIVGRYGEVRLLDWGIARVEGESELGGTSGTVTQVGAVIGTPGFLAPEQSGGDPDLHGPACDVFSLGASLYNVLAGKRPHTAGPDAVPGPPNLAALVRDATAPAPRDRPTALEFAEVLGHHLDGAYRAELARKMVDEVRPNWAPIRALTDEATLLEAEARKTLGELPAHADSDAKRPGWHLEDRARRLRRKAALARLEQLQSLHGALNLDASCVEAHEELADLYAEDLVEAERHGDRTAAAVARTLLEQHDEGRHQALIRGMGTVELDTAPSGVRCIVQHYRERDRRLQPYKENELGPTPISVELPAGSYLFRLVRPGHADVNYPVVVRRGATWETRRPVPLPTVPEGWAYVPEGPFIAGGDPRAPDVLPVSRPWLDGFLICKLAVTVEEYLPFVVEHPEHAPRLHGAPLHMEEREGDWALLSHARFPVTGITWHSAAAFAAWSGARLPTSLECEKAARGVDGRHYPWGDHADPMFTAIAASRAGAPRPWIVGTSRFDESPYGIRDLAGNARTWTSDTYHPDDDSYRVLRGGSHIDQPHFCRSAGRLAANPDRRMLVIGVRLVRDLPLTSP